jgi:hypothetical protein
VLRDILQDDVAAGVVDYGSFRVAQRGAGANMSCDVGVGGSGKAVGIRPLQLQRHELRAPAREYDGAL